MLLDNDAFLSALTKMFAESKSGKSLFITMKRHDGRTKPVPRKKGNQVPRASTSGENCCLMRVTLGSKKISTLIYQRDMNRFNQAYANVIKANIDGLKKRDKRSGGAAATVASSKTITSSKVASSSPRTPSASV
ncbi:signal recognition particle 14 kda protein [Echinococcus multilocularis]|uniref:Signal recognition particle 14 kDa protein n=1 Tax=Echinococcus multilocularis TaxID=6211 RepID=A0A068Y345_ECHMU|nr:signal recognition particle 14 kda protein [Echinococcus multilocularis]